MRRHPAGYLRAAREATRSAGALLILDEVQTGIGRCGSWFAFQDPDLGEGIVPDIVTCAKGLGGGLPLGATLTFGDAVTGLLVPGQHGSTYSGNPVTTAAGLAVLTTIERAGLLPAVRDLGQEFAGRLRLIDGVAAVSGAGLLIALELTAGNAKAVAEAALDAGFIVNPVTDTRLRIAPPLTITEGELGEFLDALPAILDTAGGTAA